ncbi:MAG TPA: DUF6624 domain-containing protein [Pyrinomonadaceae bacterium]|jgi:hypothetical protein|nr:DUF6624 domain-containing protein [Pyrinomonadaceae bacterium]
MNFATLRLLSLCAALACVAMPALARTPQTPKPDQKTSAAPPPKNEALRQELLKMLDADQAVRAPMATGKWVNKDEMKKVSEVDATNTKRLAEIFKRYGFPTVALVGKDGAQAALVMVIHSPSLDLKKRSLPYITRASRRGEIPPDAFASLTDTILVAEGKPQIYGTRFNLVGGKFVLAPTRDPAHLDARRRELGLSPIKEYAKGMAEMYKMPVDTGLPR